MEDQRSWTGREKWNYSLLLFLINNSVLIPSLKSFPVLQSPATVGSLVMVIASDPIKHLLISCEALPLPPQCREQEGPRALALAENVLGEND